MSKSLISSVIYRPHKSMEGFRIKFVVFIITITAKKSTIAHLCYSLHCKKIAAAKSSCLQTYFYCLLIIIIYMLYFYKICVMLRWA